MRFLKNISLFIVFFYFCGFSSENSIGSRNYSPGQQYIPKEMHPGEDITYVVSYGFIKFGEVRLLILDEKQKDGMTYFRTKAYIDSYSGIPFVNLHQIYESNFDKNLYSDYFRATEREKDYIKFTEYFYDSNRRTVHIKKGKYNPFEIWADSTTTVKTGSYQDGLSLFYYARMNTGQKKSLNVPCFVTEEFVFTKINFYDKEVKTSIDAVDYDIASVRLDGHTDFVSIFGLTGNFEGWFTNDKYAVPTIAKMKVIIGNVTLELKSWKISGGWTPPRA
ncbi:MAG TPA: DUF3108 domain-containing protein [Ignavibacteriales bacterium]|nr:DUF3108 domain-containing protein [Ignavibacteriales bacterium]